MRIRNNGDHCLYWFLLLKCRPPEVRLYFGCMLTCWFEAEITSCAAQKHLSTRAIWYPKCWKSSAKMWFTTKKNAFSPKLMCYLKFLPLIICLRFEFVLIPKSIKKFLHWSQDLDHLQTLWVGNRLTPSMNCFCIILLVNKRFKQMN